LSDNILMVKQDVPSMLDMLWKIIAEDTPPQTIVQIQPLAAAL
jgi:hypothetical protein